MGEAGRDHVPRHIVVRCHPEQESFNAAVANAYCAAVRQHGHDVFERDLYAMGFDPVLKSVERPGPAFQQMPDVQNELRIIAGADFFVLVYPIWFGGPPAMLKGYIDRVLGTGAMPAEFQRQAATGVLAHQSLVSFTSSATDQDWLASQGQLQSLVSGFDRYIERGFAMLPSQHFHFGAVTAKAEPALIEQYLSDVTKYAEKICQATDR